MAVVTMKQLLDSGTHFGHQTRRWNPKMKRFIFTDRNGIYIDEATRVGMPYVNQRWLGGMLTNFSTVHKRLQRLKEL